MGDCGKGSDKYGRDLAGTGDDVQCGGSDGVNLREKELGSDRGNDEGTERVIPSGGP